MNNSARNPAPALVFNPLSPDFIRDPYPFYRQLREHDPMHRTPLGMYLASRNAEVTWVLRDKRFGKDYVGRTTKRYGPAIMAARFGPVYRAAMKLRASCERDSAMKELCDRPRYQAPVLAIFTSAGDQATKVAFPVGAGLSNMFENTLSEAQRQSIVQTIGWDDNYATHTVNLTPSCDSASSDPFDPATSPLRYKSPGWSWCFKTQSGSMLFSHLGRTPSPGQRVIYNGPLWNVRVPISIMSNHNDTWNDKFRDLLLHLFTDERRNPSVF